MYLYIYYTNMYAYTYIYTIQYTATLVGNLPWSFLGVFLKIPNNSFSHRSESRATRWQSLAKSIQRDAPWCASDLWEWWTGADQRPKRWFHDSQPRILWTQGRLRWCPPNVSIYVVLMLYNQLENKHRYQYHLHFYNFYFDGNAPRISLIRTS